MFHSSFIRWDQKVFYSWFTEWDQKMLQSRFIRWDQKIFYSWFTEWNQKMFHSWFTEWDQKMFTAGSQNDTRRCFIASYTAHKILNHKYKVVQVFFTRSGWAVFFYLHVYIGAGVAQSVQWLGYGQNDLVSIPGRRSGKYFSSAAASKPVLGPAQPPIQRIPKFFPWE
jgi:hypothetical protein